MIVGVKIITRYDDCMRDFRIGQSSKAKPNGTNTCNGINVTM